MRWVRGCAKHKKRDRHSLRSAFLVHTASAVYCQLGDIRKGLIRPSKSDVNLNPSGKQVRESAIRVVATCQKQMFVQNPTQCSELAGYAQGAYANPRARKQAQRKRLSLNFDQREKES